MRRQMTCLELCAGAGGQALGLEASGFEHIALVEIDPNCCATLRLNRPDWHVIQTDLRKFDASPFRGIDLLAGGLPCPPFSVAGKQLGCNDERNLFPDALRIVSECDPTAVMIENVRGLLGPTFDEYRNYLEGQLRDLGYRSQWRLFNASDFGVPQLRPRAVLVALKESLYTDFAWPLRRFQIAPSVGNVLFDLMAAEGWAGAKLWRSTANQIAPTIVGGSRKHGGPDLGPTRARQAWSKLSVDGRGIADGAPAIGFSGIPRLTVRMVARIQGFPDTWLFSGKKTNAYRQVGNAFPPPFAQAVAEQIRFCLSSETRLSLAG